MSNKDMDAILDLINNGGDKDNISQDTVNRVRDVLLDLICGEDVLKKLGCKRKPGQRKKILDPELIPTDHPLFAVAMKVEEGTITYTEAVSQFSKINHLPKRTNEKYLKIIRPRAKNAIELKSLLKSKSKI